MLLFLRALSASVSSQMSLYPRRRERALFRRPHHIGQIRKKNGERLWRARNCPLRERNRVELSWTASQVMICWSPHLSSLSLESERCTLHRTSNARNARISDVWKFFIFARNPITEWASCHECNTFKGRRRKDVSEILRNVFVCFTIPWLYPRKIWLYHNDICTFFELTVHGPHTKTQLLFWYQREVWTNVICHPVDGAMGNMNAI